LIRPTKAIAKWTIAEEEDRYGKAAAVPVARKKWNIELNYYIDTNLLKSLSGSPK